MSCLLLLMIINIKIFLIFFFELKSKYDEETNVKKKLNYGDG